MYVCIFETYVQFFLFFQTAIVMLSTLYQHIPQAQVWLFLTGFTIKLHIACNSVNMVRGIVDIMDITWQDIACLIIT